MNKNCVNDFKRVSIEQVSYLSVEISKNHGNTFRFLIHFNEVISILFYNQLTDDL